MCYKELGLILVIVILLATIFYFENRLYLSPAEPKAPVLRQMEEPDLPVVPIVPIGTAGLVPGIVPKAQQSPKPVEAIKQPSDHSYPFPRMMDGYLDETTLQRPCTNDSDCITGNCGPYGYCAAQYKKLVPSSKFLYTDQFARADSYDLFT